MKMNTPETDNNKNIESTSTNENKMNEEIKATTSKEVGILGTKIGTKKDIEEMKAEIEKQGYTIEEEGENYIRYNKNKLSQETTYNSSYQGKDENLKQGNNINISDSPQTSENTTPHQQTDYKENQNTQKTHTTKQTTTTSETTPETTNSGDLEYIEEGNYLLSECPQLISIKTIDGFIKTLDQLLIDINSCKNGITRKTNSSGKKTMTTAKKKLKHYEKLITTKKEALQTEKNKGTSYAIYDQEISIIQDWWTEINNIHYDIRMGQMGELSSTASIQYNSPEEAKKGNKEQARTLKFRNKLNTIVKQGAILNILNKNAQSTGEFFRKIAEGEYSDAEYQIYTTNKDLIDPYLKYCGISPQGITQNYGTHNNRKGTIDNPYGIQDLKLNGSNIGLDNSQEKTGGLRDYSHMSRGETFKQGGIFGMLNKALDYTNMKPGSKATWGSLGSLALIGGAIRGGIEIIKTTNKNNRRKRLLGTGLGVFTTQVITGKDPISILKGIFTGGKELQELEQNLGICLDNISDSENGQNLISSQIPYLIFSPDTNVQQIRQLTTTFSTNQEARSEFYTKSEQTLKNHKQNSMLEIFRAKFFKEKFDQQKWNERLSSFGITENTPEDITINILSGNTGGNIALLTKFEQDNNLTITKNQEKQKELYNYIIKQNKLGLAIETSVLEEHKEDRFESNDSAGNQNETHRNNIQKLQNKVQELPLSDDKKTELKIALAEFYNNKPDNQKPNVDNISLEMNGDYITFKSNQNPNGVDIDLKIKGLKGFGNTNENNYNIPFNNLTELITVADLTNLTLGITKGRTTNSYDKIFVHRNMAKGIYFDDNQGLFDLDTRILSSGRGGSTTNIITIQNHLDEYAQYLTKQRIDINKIDLSNYPYLKNMGIDFINQDQTSDLNKKIQEIAERFEFASGKIGGNPFSIGLTGNLIFTQVDGTEEKLFNINQYTTLTYDKNKNKFLQYINNPNNKIYKKQ